MDPDAPMDQLIRQLNGMSREQCIHELTHFERIPLDFRRDDLERMSLEWLQHVLLAAVVTANRRPGGRATPVPVGSSDESE